MKIDESSYQLLRSRFLARMPGFTTFREHSGYLESERNYKVELCELFNASVRPHLSDSESTEPQVLGTRLLELFTRTLKNGSPQNIVDWRSHSAIATAAKELDGRRQFVQRVQSILDNTRPLKERVDSFSSYVRGIPGPNGKRLSAASTRRLGTFLLTLFDPASCIFVKTTEFKKLFDVLGTNYEFSRNGLCAADIEHVMEIARGLLERLKQEPWGFVDLIDVQGFLWLALNQQPDQAQDADVLLIRLTAGALRNGYVAFNRVPEEFFPVDAFGGDTDADAGQPFALKLPDGSSVLTDIRGDAQRLSGRLRKRFGALFQSFSLSEGAVVRLKRISDREYAMSLEADEIEDEATVEGPEGFVIHSAPPMNQILFGPPGTGKTYHSITEALRITDPEYLKVHFSNRTMLRRRFDELVHDKRVRVVTFHQSFSYEDFVEGIRASSDPENSGIVSYSIERGVFTEVCDAARLSPLGRTNSGVRQNARIWKLSIGRRQDTTIREECFARGEARIGWGYVGDLSNPGRPKKEIEAFEREGEKNKHSLMSFYEGMSKGDIVLCLKSQSSIEAVGIVESDYEFDPSGTDVWTDYFHRRKVNWLATDLDADILPLNGGIGLTQKTIYELPRIAAADALALAKRPATSSEPALPYVLIIDEINRGNISKIFGELITLLEPSKRAGASEALEVVLPYSKRSFSVPSNVHVIGTMNTADRSLATLDIALRRRFTFIEMAPRPEELSGITIDGIDVAEMLRVMNQRIEVLLDRDHALGHAYFLPLNEDPGFEHLTAIFRNQILPLLQEYFFEDWERIRWVLNDHRKPSELHMFVVRPMYDVRKLLGQEPGMPTESMHWQVNESAFAFAESFRGVIEA